MSDVIIIFLVLLEFQPGLWIYSQSGIFHYLLEEGSLIYIDVYDHKSDRIKLFKYQKQTNNNSRMNYISGVNNFDCLNFL